MFENLTTRPDLTRDLSKPLDPIPPDRLDSEKPVRYSCLLAQLATWVELLRATWNWELEKFLRRHVQYGHAESFRRYLIV